MFFYHFLVMRVQLKRIVFLVILLGLFFISDVHVSACTIFSAQKNENVLVGNNEDYFYQYSSDMWFAAASDESYGRVCFANAHYVQGGMNEKGLFYDGAYCPSTEVPYIKDKPSLGMNLGEVVLSKCANVDEAVEMLKKYNIPAGFGDHLLFADETGKSVIIEWVQNEMKIIPKEISYQIATNFFISKPELGGYPCSRYDTVIKMLEDSSDISMNSFIGILAATSQKWDNGGTKYSNIYDLKKKVVYVFSKGDFSKVADFHLDEELQKIGQDKRIEYDIDKLQYERIDINQLAETTQIDENARGINWWLSIPISIGVFGILFFISRRRVKIKV